MLSLRNYQQQAKEQINTFYANGNKKVLLQMPTGAGKTRLFCNIIHDERKANDQFKCMVVAHTDELINQIKGELSKYAIETGVIKAGQPRDYFQPVQVASIGTLAGDFELDGNVDMVVIDEAHRTGAPQYKELFKRFPHARFLGATATPCRMDGQALGDFYDNIVVGPDIRKLIEMGHLAAIKLIRPLSISEELARVKTGIDGDYAPDDLARVMNRAPIRARLVDSYIKHCYGKKGIVYAINRNHARDICAEYNRHNIPAEFIVSGEGMSAQERDRIVKRFLKGEFRVLVNVNIFSEGFDCPDADFIQLARPTKSLILYLQQIGRGIRNFPNSKKQAIILDNAGLSLQHGSIISAHWDWIRIFQEGLTDGYPFSPDGVTRRLLDEQGNIPDEVLEGDGRLIVEEFGQVIADDDPIIEFFSQALFDLYNTIKSQRFLRDNDYESAPVIEAIKILEPYWFDLAWQNQLFYTETEELLDTIQIEKSARETEWKNLEGILKSYESIENKIEIDEIAAHLRDSRKLKLIQLTEEQRENLQKTLQTRFSLPMEIIEELIDGTFSIEAIKDEKEGLSKELNLIEKGIDEISNKLLRIKELAREGKNARLEIEDVSETTKGFVETDRDLVMDDDLPFDGANKEMFSNVLEHSLVKNSKILTDVFTRLLNVADELFVESLKLLYFYPNVFYKKSGFGPLKIRDCKNVIRRFLLNKENINTLVGFYFKEEAKNYTYKNELRFLQDVLLLSTAISDIQKEVLKYYNKKKIFLQGGENKTYDEIAQKLNANEITVRVNSSRLNIDMFCKDILKNVSSETKQILSAQILPSADDDIKVVEAEVINKLFETDFNAKGLELLVKEVFPTEDLSLVSDCQLKNLYVFKQADNINTFDRIVEFIIQIRTGLKSKLNTIDFRTWERKLLGIMANYELADMSLIEIDQVLQVSSNISQRDVVVLALKSFNRPATSAEIFTWCEENHPGILIVSQKRLGADLLTRMENLVKVGKHGRGRMWALK